MAQRLSEIDEKLRTGWVRFRMGGTSWSYAHYYAGRDRYSLVSSDHVVLCGKKFHGYMWAAADWSPVCSKCLALLEAQEVAEE